MITEKELKEMLKKHIEDIDNKILKVKNMKEIESQKIPQNIKDVVISILENSKLEWSKFINKQ